MYADVDESDDAPVAHALGDSRIHHRGRNLVTPQVETKHLAATRREPQLCFCSMSRRNQQNVRPGSGIGRRTKGEAHGI